MRFGGMVTLREIVRVFGRIGWLSFGGPAAQIALMHKELVEDRPWLSEEQFLRALSFCMMLPGPEAMQLATYAGWRLRGVLGGLIGGALFVLPGALVIVALAAIYSHYGEVPLVQAAFAGVQATVVVVVAQAIWRLSQKALRGPGDVALAGLAFLGLFALRLPFPAIIAAAALWGTLTPRSAAAATATAPAGKPLWPVVALLAVLWAAPLGLLWASSAEFLLSLGLFFSKLAVVTFGGAYAVLAYMTQEVVQTHGWLTTAQMIDALGLAETTPGPLILVTQFTAHLAGAPRGLMLTAGALALWVTFIPCFLWIFAGAPFIDRLERQPRLAAALRGITAAVVGVIGNLSVWFSAHVLFAQIGEARLGPLRLLAPDWASLSPIALILIALAAALLLWRKVSLPRTLLCAALVSVLLAAAMMPSSLAG